MELNIIDEKNRSKNSKNYLLSNFHPWWISWPSYRVERKKDECRLHIYIRNASDTLKWQWISRFSRNYVDMLFLNDIWWRHQCNLSTFTSKSWTSTPIVISFGENTYNFHFIHENADSRNEPKFAWILI